MDTVGFRDDYENPQLPTTLAVAENERPGWRDEAVLISEMSDIGSKMFTALFRAAEERVFRSVVDESAVVVTFWTVPSRAR
ncbi:hypothetical protein Q9L58_009220 [Maublancomyces gigas]|uniref:Uncharacterized protein n=1 Tax=Discina gigas TaxID=1032678 RepID=A0ABR3G7G9_9PEZI